MGITPAGRRAPGASETPQHMHAASAVTMVRSAHSLVISNFLSNLAKNDVEELESASPPVDADATRTPHPHPQQNQGPMMVHISKKKMNKMRRTISKQR